MKIPNHKGISNRGTLKMNQSDTFSFAPLNSTQSETGDQSISTDINML